MRRFIRVFSLVISLFPLAPYVAMAREELVTIRRTVRAGQSVTLPFDASRITKVEVLVKRTNPKQSDTYLTVDHSAGRPMDGRRDAQVDRQDLHAITWFVRAEKSGNGNILLTAHSGDVYFESASVSLEEAEPSLQPRQEDRHEVVRISRKLRSGESFTLEYDAPQLSRVEALVRRVDSRQKETRLALTIGNGRADGEIATQIDRQELHWVSWNLPEKINTGGKARFTALHGDVVVETVKVTLRPQ